MKKIGVVIPAWNEENDIQFVLEVVSSVDWLAQVIVVDDGSTDNTLTVAQEIACLYPNMEVRHLEENQGKGAAMLTGVQSLQADIDLVIFIDADLVGFSESHLALLSDPVKNQHCEMTVAGFRKGYWRTDLSQWFAPNLSGQRCLHRKAAEIALVPLAESGYGVEIGLTYFARRKNWRVEYVVWEGTSHDIKESKLGLRKGLKIRRGMYQQILAIMLREWWQTHIEKLKPFWEIGS
jgi:glycosyltransferase involved in cell wall biosynthesis